MSSAYTFVGYDSLSVLTSRSVFFVFFLIKIISHSKCKRVNGKRPCAKNTRILGLYNPNRNPLVYSVNMARTGGYELCGSIIALWLWSGIFVMACAKCEKRKLNPLCGEMIMILKVNDDKLCGYTKNGIILKQNWP